jgi:hypothetical protein
MEWRRKEKVPKARTTPPPGECPSFINAAREEGRLEGAKKGSNVGAWNRRAIVIERFIEICMEPGMRAVQTRVLVTEREDGSACALPAWPVLALSPHLTFTKQAARLPFAPQTQAPTRRCVYLKKPVKGCSVRTKAVHDVTWLLLAVLYSFVRSGRTGAKMPPLLFRADGLMSHQC